MMILFCSGAKIKKAAQSDLFFKAGRQKPDLMLFKTHVK